MNKFNPLDRVNLGAQSVADALVEITNDGIVFTSSFNGAGIHSIYYHQGSFKPYNKISGIKSPIYVGKAVPQALEKGLM